MNKKQVLLTFDYELFLGSLSGTAKNCLINPTNNLIKVLSKHQIKAIFFIDILYLVRLKELVESNTKAKEDYALVVAQIQKLAQLGHYIYLHIHPHWLDAVYIAEKNQWNLSDIHRFALSNLSNQDRELVLKNGLLALQDVLSNVPNAHKVEGFRAGGLYVQPFNLLSAFLKQNGLPFEFSVYPNFKSEAQGARVDFTKVPNNRIYSFENDCCVEEKDGYFKQFTISEIQFLGINRIVNSIYFRINTKLLKDKAWGDGKGAAHIVQNNDVKIGVQGVVKESAAVELMNFWKNKTYMEYLEQNSLLHFLSHPKLISPHNLRALDSFLTQAKKKYQISTDFKKFVA